MKTTLLALAAFASFSVFACAAHHDDSNSSSEDLSHASGAAEGQSCMGLAPIKCAAGLVCDSDAEADFGDQGGKCIKIVPGQLGASCGTGITGIKEECKTGFRCTIDVNKNFGDQTGTCVVAKPGELGGTCGTGITGLTVKCQTGKCSVADEATGDQTGTCVE
jgi:hypothetical protein